MLSQMCNWITYNLFKYSVDLCVSVSVCVFVSFLSPISVYFISSFCSSFWSHSRVRHWEWVSVVSVLGCGYECEFLFTLRFLFTIDIIRWEYTQYMTLDAVAAYSSRFCALSFRCFWDISFFWCSLISFFYYLRCMHNGPLFSSCWNDIILVTAPKKNTIYSHLIWYLYAQWRCTVCKASLKNEIVQNAHTQSGIVRRA